MILCGELYKTTKLIGRLDSERQLFTTTSSTTFTQCAPEATEFGELTQNKGHYAVQGHSRSPILVPIERSYDFLLLINTNLPPILHRFPDTGRPTAFDRSKIAICMAGPLAFAPPPSTEAFPWNDLCKIFHGLPGYQMQ